MQMPEGNAFGAGPAADQGDWILPHGLRAPLPDPGGHRPVRVEIPLFPAGGLDRQITNHGQYSAKEPSSAPPHLESRLLFPHIARNGPRIKGSRIHSSGLPAAGGLPVISARG